MSIRRLETGICTSRHPVCKVNDIGDIPFESDETVELLPKECGKPIQVIDTYDYSETEVIRFFKCGHWDKVPKHIHLEQTERNILWDNLLPFQKEFIPFWEKSPNKRVILRDEMGLGKTVQVLSCIRENISEFTKNSTAYCVICVLPGAIYQWQEEATFWLGLEKPKTFEQIQMVPQVITLAGQPLSPLSNLIIIPWTRLKDPKIQAQLKAKGIASIIVDECHFYKDMKSARTKALLELFKIAGNDAPAIFMSGTLVENRIEEMDIPLHLCDPTFFNTKATLYGFIQWDYESKRGLGIKQNLRERFFNRVNRYMIGRSKAEAGIPLPEFEDRTIWLNPFNYKANEDIAKAYDKTMDELENLLDLPEITSGQIIGIMQQLRHLTGRLKLLPAAIWIAKWLEDNPTEKITIGVHHVWVREKLAALLSKWAPLQMSSEDAEEKDRIEKEFKNDPIKRILIASIIAAGTGRNLQFCRNAVILERQWNRSKEDQFKQRFHRILRDDEGRVRSHFTEADTVRVYTLDGENTFDEFFHEMVSLKGYIVDSADESIDDLPPEDFAIQIARNMVSKRRKYLGV